MTHNYRTDKVIDWLTNGAGAWGEHWTTNINPRPACGDVRLGKPATRAQCSGGAPCGRRAGGSGGEGHSVRLRAWGSCGRTLLGFGPSRGASGHGTAGKAAQGAEIWPAAKVSWGSPSRAGRPADSSALGPGLSDREVRSGLPQASCRAGRCGAWKPALGTPAWGCVCSSRAGLTHPAGAPALLVVSI